MSSTTLSQQPSTELRNLNAVTNGAHVRGRGGLFWTGSGDTMVASRIVAVQ